MRSPEELSRRLARQWDDADTREARLLEGGKAWPISLSIGRPPPRAVTDDLDGLKRHIERWRKVRIGEVRWETTSYRAASDPVTYPSSWDLRDPEEWIGACGNRDVREEWERLQAFVEAALPVFHPTLIRRRSLWRSRPNDEVFQAIQLAAVLEPGCAQGRPLRTLSLAGVDTKFFERNERFIAALLDARFHGEVTEIGFPQFLDASVETDHWLLIADLDGGLLPFNRLRVRSFELKTSPLPGRRLIIVENESSLHQLPQLPGTIAVLGAGFDLTWTVAPWLREKHVAYWGDIDTWGLQFLARARTAIPQLASLLMSSEVFDFCRASAVPEPVRATGEAPDGLTPSERDLYRRLLGEDRGRLEQEFLPAGLVEEAIAGWADGAGSSVAKE